MREKNSIFFAVLLLLFTVINFAFFQDTTTQTVKDKNALHPAVQKTIDDRVERYRKRLLKDCERRVLEKATAMVDSIIIANAKRIKAMPIGRPPKPIRPREDGSDVPFDSTKIEPLWNLDSLLYEQLLRRRSIMDSLLVDSLLLDSLFRDSIRLDSLKRTTSSPEGR